MAVKTKSKSKTSHSQRRTTGAASRTSPSRKTKSRTTISRTAGTRASIRTAAKPASRTRASAARSKRLTEIATDHHEIVRWAQDRGAQPARVKGTGRGDAGLIRLEFPKAPNANDDKLEPISWDEWFDEFEKKNLALVYEETNASGHKSNFNKLVSRERAGENS